MRTSVRLRPGWRAVAMMFAVVSWSEFSAAQSPGDEEAPVASDQPPPPQEGRGSPGSETETTDSELDDEEPVADDDAQDARGDDAQDARGDDAQGARGEGANAEVHAVSPAVSPTPRAERTERWESDGDSLAEEDESEAPGRGHFELVPGGYFQTRLERTSFEHVGHAEAGAGDIHPSHFDVDLTIPRAAAYLEGSVYDPALTFRVQVGVDPGFALEDLYVNYAFAEGFQLRVGKDKRPFSRQFLTRRNHLQFSDLSPVERYFAIDRDVGVLVHNDYLNTTGFEYALGVYQGKHTVTYDTFSRRDDEPFVVRVREDDTADDIEPTVVFRVGVNNGPLSYRESALGSRKYQYGVGLSGLMDLNTNRSGAARGEVELDAIFKVGGFSISSMIAMKLQQTGDEFFKNRDQGGAATSMQTGYVFAERVEPVIRLSAALVGEIDYDAISTVETESAVGLNVYFFGQDLRWTNEFSLTRWSESYGQPEDMVVRRTFFRSQLQFGFRGI